MKRKGKIDPNEKIDEKKTEKTPKITTTKNEGVGVSIIFKI